MKKTKFSFIAGTIALAIAAGTTYAWFTSESGPGDFTVNTATIAIKEDAIVENLALKLPGEILGFDEWTFENNSTRESVVEFSISAVEITDRDGDRFSPDREAELLALLNDPSNIKINGIEAGNNQPYTDPKTGYMYIWLNAGEQLDNAAISIGLIVPEELGGNYKGSDNRPEEHEAIIHLNCRAYAVQGTEAALKDIFGTSIAAIFFPVTI